MGISFCNGTILLFSFYTINEKLQDRKRGNWSEVLSRTLKAKKYTFVQISKDIKSGQTKFVFSLPKLNIVVYSIQ